MKVRLFIPISIMIMAALLLVIAMVSPPNSNNRSVGRIVRAGTEAGWAGTYSLRPVAFDESKLAAIGFNISRRIMNAALTMTEREQAMENLLNLDPSQERWIYILLQSQSQETRERTKEVIRSLTGYISSDYTDGLWLIENGHDYGIYYVSRGIQHMILDMRKEFTFRKRVNGIFEDLVSPDEKKRLEAQSTLTPQGLAKLREEGYYDAHISRIFPLLISRIESTPAPEDRARLLHGLYSLGTWAATQYLIGLVNTDEPLIAAAARQLLSNAPMLKELTIPELSGILKRHEPEALDQIMEILLSQRSNQDKAKALFQLHEELKSPVARILIMRDLAKLLNTETIAQLWPALNNMERKTVMDVLSVQGSDGSVKALIDIASNPEFSVTDRAYAVNCLNRGVSQKIPAFLKEGDAISQLCMRVTEGFCRAFDDTNLRSVVKPALIAIARENPELTSYIVRSMNAVTTARENAFEVMSAIASDEAVRFLFETLIADPARYPAEKALILCKNPLVARMAKDLYNNPQNSVTDRASYLEIFALRSENPQEADQLLLNALSSPATDDSEIKTAAVKNLRPSLLGGVRVGEIIDAYRRVFEQTTNRGLRGAIIQSLLMMDFAQRERTLPYLGNLLLILNRGPLDASSRERAGEVIANYRSDEETRNALIAVQI